MTTKTLSTTDAVDRLARVATFAALGV